MRNFDFILKVVKTMQELGEQMRHLDLCSEDARSYSMDNGAGWEERQQGRPLGGYHDGPAVKWHSKQSRAGNQRRGKSFSSVYQFGGAAPTTQDKVIKQ